MNHCISRLDGVFIHTLIAFSTVSVVILVLHAHAGQLKQRLLEATELSGTDTDWSSEIQLAKWPKWKNTIKINQVRSCAYLGLI